MSGVLVATAEGMKLGVPATCPSGWGSSGVEDRELPSPSSSLGLFQRLFSHDGVMKSLTESETRAKRDCGREEQNEIKNEIPEFLALIFFLRTCPF